MIQRKILLADNDPNFLLITRDFLESKGYQVLTAANPSTARKILLQHKPDLAIVDLRLMDNNDQLDKSGLWLAEEMMWASDVPHIILTGFTAPAEHVREALKRNPEGKAPAVNFIMKREGLLVLLEAVQEALRIDLRRLHTRIMARFSAAELHELCFLDLNVDYENIPGDSKGEKVMALLIYCQSRQQMKRLIMICRQSRPNVDWD